MSFTARYYQLDYARLSSTGKRVLKDGATHRDRASARVLIDAELEAMKLPEPPDNVFAPASILDLMPELPLPTIEEVPVADPKPGKHALDDSGRCRSCGLYCVLDVMGLDDLYDVEL